MKKAEQYATESVWRLMVKLCIPTIVTILVVIAYNMADLLFIGQTGDTAQVAAISMTSPIFAIFSGLGTLLGSGGCAAISVALGRREEEKLRAMSGFCCYFALGISVLVGVVILIGMDVILPLLNISAEAAPHARQYLTWLSIGAPFIIFSNAFANIVRAEGSIKEAMLANGIGTVLNIVLDPILILAFGMGASGAAIATVLGNVAASIYLIRYIRSKRSGLSLSPKHFSFRREIGGKILALGLPTALGVLMTSISAILYNGMVSGYGDAAIAAAGVSGKAGMVIAMLQMGMCLGIQPALSYNYGAGNLGRIVEFCKKTVLVTTVLGVLSSLMFYLARSSFMGAFLNNPEVAVLGGRMIFAGCLSGPVFGLFYLSTTFLQATERAALATVTSLLRQGIVLIPLLLLLNTLAGLDGIIYAQSIADYVAAIISGVLCIVQYKAIRGALDTSEPMAEQAA